MSLYSSSYPVYMTTATLRMTKRLPSRGDRHREAQTVDRCILCRGSCCRKASCDELLSVYRAMHTLSAVARAVNEATALQILFRDLRRRVAQVEFGNRQGRDLAHSRRRTKR
jgi:hypothetical protein